MFHNITVYVKLISSCNLPVGGSTMFILSGLVRHEWNIFQVSDFVGIFPVTVANWQF